MSGCSARPHALRIEPLSLSFDDARDCDLETHFRPMESWCHLFARKFAADTAEPLVRLYSDEWAHNVAIFRF